MGPKDLSRIMEVQNLNIEVVWEQLGMAGS